MGTSARAIVEHTAARQPQSFTRAQVCPAVGFHLRFTAHFVLAVSLHMGAFEHRLLTIHSAQIVAFLQLLALHPPIALLPTAGLLHLPGPQHLTSTGSRLSRRPTNGAGL